MRTTDSRHIGKCSRRPLCLCSLGGNIGHTGQEDDLAMASAGMRPIAVSFVFSQRLSVLERDLGNTALDALISHANVKKEGASGFGPLKSLLRTISDIYTNHEVRP